MTPTEWIAVGQLAVAAVGVGSIWFGIWQMRRAGDQRADREDARHAESMEALREMRRAGDQREEREDARHAENMEALRALVAGLDRQGQALERQGIALERQGAALEAALKGRV